MRVHIYSRGSQHHAHRWLEAAIAGFRRHGIEPTILPVGSPRPCDLAVIWAFRRRAEIRSGRRALIMERGYVGDRFYWTSMGFDGLNGHADFCNHGMTGDRWERHFVRFMKPWRDNKAGDVLIAGQVPNDASLRGLDIVKWCQETADRLRIAGLPSRIRWHPRARGGTMHPPMDSLADALGEARWLVTFNSNSAVDAVLAGVPAVTMDRGSMAWDVTGHKVVHPPPMPDRTQWAHDLAYTQWSPDEIAAGDAWAHLAKGMEADACRAAG